MARSEEAADEASARRQLETAKQIVAALGTMKGAAMKLGQVMSFLDVGLVPEQHREEFQRELAKLRDAAPTVSFKQMRRWSRTISASRSREVFAAFDEEPIAAASIGQVYAPRCTTAATWRSRCSTRGSPPPCARTCRTWDMILRLMKRMAPGLDAKATAEEISSRIDEELDYELEAQNQRRWLASTAATRSSTCPT